MSERVNALQEKKGENRGRPRPVSRHTASRDTPVGNILHLQRTLGNREVRRLIRSGKIQAKLKIGKPNDKYEQEADRIAVKVMSMPEPKAPPVQRKPGCPDCPEKEEIQTKPLADQITPLVQRQTEEDEEPVQSKLLQRQETEEEEPVRTKIQRQADKEEEENVQTKIQRQVDKEEEHEEPVQAKPASNQTPAVTPNVESNINSLKGGGQPLPESTRSYFEPRFGADFSQVRVHTGSQAAETAKSINARAFTKGNDVVFGSGQYSPETSSGKGLLAHELTHVVQQRGCSIGASNRAAIQRDPQSKRYRRRRRWRKAPGRVTKGKYYKWRLWAFDYNKYNLKPEHKSVLSNTIAPLIWKEFTKHRRLMPRPIVIKHIPKPMNVTLEGHASLEGKPFHNYILSGLRNFSVRNYLGKSTQAQMADFEFGSRSKPKFYMHSYGSKKADRTRVKAWNRAVVITLWITPRFKIPKERMVKVTASSLSEAVKKVKVARLEHYRLKLDHFLVKIFKETNRRCERISFGHLAKSGLSSGGGLKGAGLAKNWTEFIQKNYPRVVPLVVKQSATYLSQLNWKHKNAVLFCTDRLSQLDVLSSGKKVPPDEFRKCFQKWLKQKWKKQKEK